MQPQFRSMLILLALVFSRQALAESPIDHYEARPHVSWEDAHQVVGKLAYVSGKVIGVREMERINFINFDEDRPPKFAGVIYQSDRSKFPDSLAEAYDGKIVAIRGIVSTYRDKPQIVLTQPDQIEVLDSQPESTVLPAPVEAVEDGQIVLATYNVLNMFDDEDDTYHLDEGTPPKPREELERLAESIRRLDADVLALEEVENRGYLERFVDVFLGDMGYEVVQMEGNDVRGIDVCLISRVPVGKVTSHRHLRFPGPNESKRRFSRDVLAVELVPNSGEPFEMWVVHLKSNSGGREFAEPVRLAEARQLRKLLDERLATDPNARIVVAGDFNDTRDSETLQTIIGSGSTALWSVSAGSEGEPPATYNQEPYLTEIDFLLCSPAMAKAYRQGSHRVEQGAPETSGSDHNPVVAKFSAQAE